MKNAIRKCVFTGTIALFAVAAVPAHATLSGSDPRPEPPSIPSYYLTVALSWLGVY